MTERQYEVTKEQAQKFENAIAALKARPSDRVDPILHAAEIAALESQLSDLRSEMIAYETGATPRSERPDR